MGSGAVVPPVSSSMGSLGSITTGFDSLVKILNVFLWDIRAFVPVPGDTPRLLVNVSADVGCHSHFVS